MRDLSSLSGVPLLLDEASGQLQLGPGIRQVEPAVRRLGDLRGVLASDDPGSDERLCYLLYRDVRAGADEWHFALHGLRYDLTVTLPGHVGDELMKTAGHYHSKAPGSVHSYAELYEVLAGQAVFLLQRVRDPEAALANTVIEEVLLIGAGPGDLLLIPPDHGHVTINAGATPLVVADLVAHACANRYDAFREARGAAYYVLAAGSPPSTRANTDYAALPSPRWFPTPAAAGLAFQGSLYQTFRDDPERFAFLTNPDLLG